MGEPVETKTKRPANSAFKQQRLAAWQPILTAGTVLPTFFVIGILFIPVGIGLLFFSQNVSESIVDYTNCIQQGSNRTCAEVINPNNSLGVCICEDQILEIKESFKGKVFIYYALTNFYQNHRRYVKSRDDSQLLGKTDVEPDESCKPFQYKENSGERKPILPCGAIANSMFSDDIELYDKSGKSIPLLRTGIAWDSDKHYKFKNPSWFNNATYLKAKYEKPLGWRKELNELDPADPNNNGLQNEDLIVWMRTAALPNFRKLYRIVDHDNQKYMGIKNGLPAGNYTLKITYSFPVKPFGGTKSIVVSTTSLLGGKNNFLGIAYIIVGSICLVLGIVFLFIHINYGKSTWEMTHVDPRTPY